jgi:hypothetical protein
LAKIQGIAKVANRINHYSASENLASRFKINQLDSNI